MVATVGKNWSLARSLVAMFDEADRRWPKRSRASDGSIGDADHAARASDHNPDSTGDVLAGDLTDDKDAGCDADLFAEHLRRSRDRRVKYVICNGRFFSSYAKDNRKAWEWADYDGPNGHFAHTHVSILDTAEAKNDLSPWFPYADAPLEDDMPLSVEDIDAVAAQVIRKLDEHGTAPGTNGFRQTVIASLQVGQQNANALAALLARPGSDVTAEDIAAAIPDGLAQAVADELAERLKD